MTDDHFEPLERLCEQIEFECKAAGALPGLRVVIAHTCVQSQAYVYRLDLPAEWPADMRLTEKPGHRDDNEEKLLSRIKGCYKGYEIVSIERAL